MSIHSTVNITAQEHMRCLGDTFHTLDGVSIAINVPLFLFNSCLIYYAAVYAKMQSFCLLGSTS